MTAYLTHFGLKKAPFAAHVVGSNVFVSPQVAAVMAALKKALAIEEAIVCLSGPVGTGKTTIAKRALDGVGKQRAVVTIGRMPFGHDEVLEILLAGLGAKQLPKSTVHRFATFRRLLQQYAEQQTRVFILVEDATRIGLDALSELEALTAADAGVSNGANLILLGDDSIGELLRNPKAARVKQRMRARQRITALTANELQGYLKHCFRLAGREFDTLFADGSAKTVAALTDGLPRVANNLLETVLATAAEKGLQKISPDLIERIAEDEFGLTLEHSISEIAAAIDKASAASVMTPAPVVEPEPVAVAEPIQAPVPEHEPPAAADDDIPELIQDTLPDLQILAPELAATETPTPPARPAPEPVAKAAPKPAQKQVQKPKAAVRPEPEPDPVYEPTENELPVLSTSMRLDTRPKASEKTAGKPDPNKTIEPPLKPQVAPAEARDEDGKVPGDVPAWDRDPTFAELRPDLEALERAMQAAHGIEAPPSVEAESLAKAAAAPKPVEAAPAAAIIPEITLDKQIEAKIQEATEALKKTKVDATAEMHSGSSASNDDESSEPQPVKPAASKQERHNNDPKNDRKLEQIKSGLAQAKTIEDVDDYMAETLFGEEFSMLAAHVAANASLQGEASQASEIATGETMGSAALSLVEEKVQAEPAPNPDTSASQRLKVLRELTHRTPPRGAPETPDATENIVMSAGGVDALPTDDAVAVESIEDQITTSMTQTLKTLAIRPDARSDSNDDDDDSDDDASGKGFFSRFRRK